jgi:hypothetical protein
LSATGALKGRRLDAIKVQLHKEVYDNRTTNLQTPSRLLTTKPHPEVLKGWWSRPVFKPPTPGPRALLEEYWREGGT